MVISRKQWGAAPPRSTPVKAHWVAGGPLWVHYSDGPPPAQTVTAEIAAVRAIQAFHQGPSRGWNDIGYAYLIAPSGRIYEGRGYGVHGAHCPGHNHEPSVCLMWKSGSVLPPKAALDAIAEVAAIVKAGVLKCHREGFPTACPGNALASWVAANRTPKRVTAAVQSSGPLTLRVNGRKVATGYLTSPVFVARVSGELRATGSKPPWVASVNGRVIGRGRLWPLGAFNKLVAATARSGLRVVLNDRATITKE